MFDVLTISKFTLYYSKKYNIKIETKYDPVHFSLDIHIDDFGSGNYNCMEGIIYSDETEEALLKIKMLINGFLAKRSIIRLEEKDDF